MPRPLTHHQQQDPPPACPEAEAAVLGAVLFAPQQAGELLDGLTGGHVTHPAHTAVLEAMTGLRTSGVLPEPVAVLERLQRTGQAHTAVFAARAAGVVLADLMEAVTTPAAASYWRDLVINYAERRRLIAIAARVEQAARHAEPDTLAAVVADAHDDLAQHVQPHRRPQADRAEVAAVAGATAGGAASGAGEVSGRGFDRGAWEAA